MKRLVACFLILILTPGLFAGCSSKATLNGIALNQYTIVYLEKHPPTASGQQRSSSP